MTRNKHAFTALPIYNQFITIGLISVMMVALAVAGIALATRELLIKNASVYTDTSIMKIDNELTALGNQLDAICVQFQTSDDCHKLFTTTRTDMLSFRTTKTVQNMGNYIMSIHSNVNDVSFFNPTLCLSSLYSEDEMTNLYNIAMTGDISENHFLGLYIPESKKQYNTPYLVYCCYIYEDGKVIGIILFSSGTNNITPVYASQAANEEYWLMDFSNNMYRLGSNELFDEESVMNHCIKYREKLLKSLSSGSYMHYPYSASNNYFVRMYYAESAKAYIVCAVSTNLIKSLMSGMQSRILFTVVIVAGFMALQMAIMYFNLIKPIKSFNTAINDINTSGKRHLTEPIMVGGCAEVRNLAEDFTNMFETIDRLNVKIYETSSRLYEEKIKVQTAEISYFRSQINPHFLYNVLSIIRAEAQKNNSPEIEAIALAMGKMYRYNTKGSPIVSFKEELEVTKAYIDIQKIRFKDRFDVIYNIPDDVLQVPVIKLILQPFVENAIIHGIEPALNPCMLYIGCSLKDDRLYIEIRDDGVGIAPTHLAELKAGLSTSDYDTSKNVGIMNTNARIRLEYGEEYGIDIESVPDDGTIVTLMLGTNLKQ